MQKRIRRIYVYFDVIRNRLRIHLNGLFSVNVRVMGIIKEDRRYELDLIFGIFCILKVEMADVRIKRKSIKVEIARNRDL